MLDDNLQAQVRRVQIWMAFIAMLLIVGGVAWAVSLVSAVVDGSETKWVSQLPDDGSLRPGVVSLPAAVERLSSLTATPGGSPDPFMSVLRDAHLVGGRTVVIHPQLRRAQLEEWEKTDDPIGGWGSHTAAMRAMEVLNKRLMESLRPAPMDGAELLRRLGRPTRRATEPIMDRRGGPIFPGGGQFREPYEVKIGEEDLLWYDDAGLHLRIRGDQVTEIHIDLDKMPDPPSLAEAVVGRWTVDRDAYRAIVDDLLATAPDEKWRAIYAAMSEAVNDYELFLELREDGTGTAWWNDLEWMSHSNGFVVGWKRGEHAEQAVRWYRGPGGIRVHLPIGGGNRIVAFALLDGQLRIDTRHPRELRLTRSAE